MPMRLLFVKATLCLAVAAVALLSHPRVSEAYTTEASWYGSSSDGLLGNTTACGEVLTPDSWLVAHRTLPCGTPVTITYNGTTVTAPVGDRGPYVAGRSLDLGPGVAAALGFTGMDVVSYSVGGSVSAPSPSPTELPSPSPPLRLLEANTGASEAKPGHTPGVYVVRPGDTLSGIASRLGVSLGYLIGANPQIENPNLIYPGDEVYY